MEYWEGNCRARIEKSSLFFHTSCRQQTGYEAVWQSNSPAEGEEKAIRIK